MGVSLRIICGIFNGILVAMVYPDPPQTRNLVWSSWKFSPEVVFPGYIIIRYTGILLPKERFMKWGHHHLKSPKVNGPSWISTLWLKKGNSHIPTISPKIVPNMFEFVNRVCLCFNAPREFLLECRECLPECRVFLHVFFCKKNA